MYRVVTNGKNIYESIMDGGVDTSFGRRLLPYRIIPYSGTSMKSDSKKRTGLSARKSFDSVEGTNGPESLCLSMLSPFVFVIAL